MKFITFDDVPEQSISTVRTKLATADNEPTYKFNQSKAITGDVSQVSVLGHTGEGANTLGGYTAKEFVEKLNKKFKTNDKAQVQDLYLIGCEAGMSINGQPALARQIADLLVKKGFSNVRIHAISNPDDKTIAGMRVEIVHDVGRQGATFGEKAGKLITYLNETQQQEDLDNQISDLETKLEASSDTREQRRIKTAMTKIRNSDTYKSRVELNETDDLLAELSRPQNTFVAKQAKCQKIFAQEQLIRGIEILIRITPVNQQLPPKKRSKLVDNLTELLKETRNADHTNWQDPVLERIQHYEKGGKGVIKSGSTFYRHLKSFQKNYLQHQTTVPTIMPSAAPVLIQRKNTKIHSEENQPLIDNKLKKLSHYYHYANQNRFHLFKAHYKEAIGDQAKAKILHKVREKLNNIQSEKELTSYKKQLQASEKYKTLTTGQGLFTRLFHLDTSSKKAVDKMISDVEKTFTPKS